VRASVWGVVLEHTLGSDLVPVRVESDSSLTNCHNFLHWTAFRYRTTATLTARYNVDQIPGIYCSQSCSMCRAGWLLVGDTVLRALVGRQVAAQLGT